MNTNVSSMYGVPSKAAVGTIHDAAGIPTGVKTHKWEKVCTHSEFASNGGSEARDQVSDSVHERERVGKNAEKAASDGKGEHDVPADDL